jgi:hypothetical protein
MKRSKPRLPRKMKKAMKGLIIWTDTGRVSYNYRFCSRHYPRTKWVVRAERHFRRLWRESQRQFRRIQELEERLAYFRSIGL